MPVFAVNASITFWNASRSPPPQLAMTVMVRLAAAVAVGAPEPCGAAVGWHAVATSVATIASVRNENTDLREEPLNIATSRHRSSASRAGWCPYEEIGRASCRERV